VLGGGPIGCELGQAFRRLGSEVTIVEAAERLLGKEEPEASALIAERLRSEGVEVRVGVEVTGAEELAGFDRVLVAAGRRPRSAGIGLEAAGVEVGESGEVLVDGRLRTSASNIFAAGDVTAKLPFTHVAAQHARAAAVNAVLGTRRKLDGAVPWVTFTDPEVARVGLTVAEARERWGERAVVARSDYSDLDRAITEAEPYGFALLVGDRRGRLVGATVAASGGGEAIAELTARVEHGDKIDSVSTTVHAYPTFAEGPSRAADEHLRRRYANPRYRALAKPVLALRRLLARG